MNGFVAFGIMMLFMAVFQFASSSKWSRTVGPIWESMGLRQFVKTPEFWKRFSIVSATVWTVGGSLLILMGILGGLR